MFTYFNQYGFEAQRLKAVLFDMDGVLFDSMANHTEAWTRAAAHHGLSMTREMVYMNEGRTGSGTINALAMEQWGRRATDSECEAIYATKSDIFNSLPPAHPMPGALELLRALQQANICIVLVTGSGQRSLLTKLNDAFPNIFVPERMVSAFDVKHGKPHPEPYLMGLTKAGVLASEAVVIENAPLGVEAAHQAGIFTIAVNTGPLANDVLAQAGANVVLPSVRALYEAAIK